MEEKNILLHTETVIDSSHKLINYDGKCANIHGHTWFVEVWIKGKPSQRDSVGILFDFGKVKQIKEKYDHKFLNDIPPFDIINSTAENLTMCMYKELKEQHPELRVR